MDKEIKNLTINQASKRENIKLSLEEDVIVSDTKKDIKKIILKRSEVCVETPTVSEGRCELAGRLRYAILYEIDSKDGGMESLAGEIPFVESVAMDTFTGDSAICDATVEDLTVSIINSRKVSISALLSCNIICERVEKAEAVMRLSGEEFYSKTTEISELSLVDSRKDIFRIHETKSLKSDKPNIEKIIWSTASLSNFEYRAENDELSMKGELHIFAIYTCEEAENAGIYSSEILPFSGKIKLSGVRAEMLCDVGVNVSNYIVSAKPDSEGELRNIDVEMTLALDIKVYEESRVKLLCDAYSLDGGLYIEKQKTDYDTLLIRNQNKFKIGERFSEKDKAILQIIHTYAQVNVEEMITTEDGLTVEGVAIFDIVYISAEDGEGFGCISKELPFSEKIDVSGMRESSFYTVKAGVCAIQAIMQGMDEIELKCTAVLDVMVLNKESVDVVTLAEYREENVVPKRRGRIIGKIMTADENLWDVAKEFHTTVESIMEVNGLATDIVTSGTRILIL